ncbi:MAG: nucleotidyltransferase domain-containing protein [Prochlorococcaceae cyanobacterium]
MQRAELLGLAPTIQAIAEAHGATNLAAFGSVARDQAGPASDLDLLVDLPPRTGLLERLALKHALEDALHCRVDLIRRRNLRPEALAEAERDAVPHG